MKAHVPQVEAPDAYGQLAVKFMRRISEVGTQAALDEEVASPSSSDPHWCEMIVRLVADRA